MLKSIKKYFDDRLADLQTGDGGKENDRELVHAADLASAALLIEVMNTDQELDAREAEKFIEVIQSTLDIADEEISELQALAEQEARDATSLYEFTRLINDNYSYQQKYQLIENMWRIAFSDEKLDKYEDHLIRRIADLIYVSHSDFIRAKLDVRTDQSG